MDKATALARLRAHGAELRTLGIARLSLFGSVARDEAGAESDVDLAAMLDPDRTIGAFAFAAMAARLKEVLGHPVDLLVSRLGNL